MHFELPASSLFYQCVLLAAVVTGFGSCSIARMFHESREGVCAKLLAPAVVDAFSVEAMRIVGIVDIIRSGEKTRRSEAMMVRSVCRGLAM